jgi:hypothetical protein
MTWYESAAHAESASAPYAAMGEPERPHASEVGDDYCLHCHRNGTYRCDRCRLPEVEGPLTDAWREFLRRQP